MTAWIYMLIPPIRKYILKVHKCWKCSCRVAPDGIMRVQNYRYVSCSPWIDLSVWRSKVHRWFFYLSTVAAYMSKFQVLLSWLWKVTLVCCSASSPSHVARRSIDGSAAWAGPGLALWTSAAAASSSRSHLWNHSRVSWPCQGWSTSSCSSSSSLTKEKKGSMSSFDN